MVFVPPGKRKLLNNSPTSNKSSKRAAQTISGIMSSNTLNQQAAANTRAAKRIEETSTTPNSKRISAYPKNHIKNNVEFMQKSNSTPTSSSSNSKMNTSPSSKFLSAKLRNNSNFVNSSEHKTASNSTNSNNKSPKSASAAQKPNKSKYASHEGTEPGGTGNNNSSEPPAIQMHSYTKENLGEQEQLYARRLGEFKYQLEKLEKLKDAEFVGVGDPELLLRRLEATLYDGETLERSAHSSFPFFGRFLQQIRGIVRESGENMSIVANWYEVQKGEAMAQYAVEHGRAIQEFQDKRRELKEGLRNENEEKKRQIEVDRHQLDINMDTSEHKPKVTRKLRRRGNNDFGVDSSNGLDSASSLHLVAGVSTSSTLLQSSNVLASSVNPVVNIPPSLMTTVQYPTKSDREQLESKKLLESANYFSSSATNLLQTSGIPASASINERKKAKLAPITFTLSEDDINEDLKQLC